MNVPQRSEADADAQPQQGMDPQQQFIQVDRFDQVIIDVETKTAGLGLNATLSPLELHLLFHFTHHRKMKKKLSTEFENVSKKVKH